MASRDQDLDKLSSLLGQCLGRIDEEAYRLQQDGEDVGFDTADRLEEHTSDLQDLIDSLLVVDLGSDTTDVNAVVKQVAESCLQEVNVPILLRQALTGESTVVAGQPGLVTVAVHRAMVLAVEPLMPGDELCLTTRTESGSVVLEIESHCQQPGARMGERGETLREFLEDLGGTFNMRSEQQDHYMVIELPQGITTERSESR